MLCLLLLITTFSFGQKKIIVYRSVPMVIVVDYRTLTNNMVIDKDKLQLVRVLEDSIGEREFGDSGRNGVILFKTIGKLELLRVNEIARIFGLKEEDKNLRICINKTVMRNPEMILIQKDKIKAVQVTKEHNWIDVSELNSNEKFINILVN